jgi:hypothetical protein
MMNVLDGDFEEEAGINSKILKKIKEKYQKKLNKGMGSLNQSELAKITIEAESQHKCADENQLFFIENCLIKIANLMALGYGEAGTHVIAGLLKKNQFFIGDSSQKGEKVMAIFGFIMINQFN